MEVTVRIHDLATFLPETEPSTLIAQEPEWALQLDWTLQTISSPCRE
jgi:hypothetical protein